MVAPLFLTREDRARAQHSQSWKSWVLRLIEPDREALEEASRFFLPGCRDFFMPRARELKNSSRWTFLPDMLPELVGPEGLPWAQIEWVDLLWTDVHPLLLIKVSGNRPFNPDDAKWTATAAASWHPAHPGASPAIWRVGGRELHLRQWILGDVLALPSERWDEVDGRVHWFGQDLPNFNLCHAEGGWPEDQVRDDLVLHFALGMSSWKEEFGPDTTTQQAILAHHLQEWANWRLYEWRNRLTLFLAGAATHGQPRNTETYYSLLFATVCYQRVRLTDFLDQATGPDAGIARLRHSFAAFRRQYLPHRVTTYVMGDRIYDFLRAANHLPEIQKEIEEQIRLADEAERLDLGRQENLTMIVLTTVAALFLPASLLTGAFGMNKMSDLTLEPVFWWGLLAAYVLGALLVGGLTVAFGRYRLLPKLSALLLGRN
ncbi:CorA family divalent cation transporter [Azospirillum palustre]|uniref:CorA family divalent cation transporter n=1 Tax=Azospirillum palustre TaxID=2044885 RepID=UPI00137A6806|nr:CorA family divalent cation transporter [Azospirillum palustre]